MTRPLLLEGREDALRADLGGVRSPQLRRLLEECERLKHVPLPVEHPSASITYFGPASANLALAFRLTRQPQYLAELRRWLTPPLAFPHWGKAHMPDHDLDAGWLLHGLSLAFAWAGDALPPAERAALRDRLVLQGTRMHEFAVASEGEWWASSYWQNHNWICFAGLATAGYVLGDEHPAASAWTALAKANFDTVLDLLPTDGSNHEGAVYWRYGEPWLVTYLDVLRAAEGVDWFPRSDHLRETFWFRLHQSAPDLERIVDHGDCHDRRSGHSVALYRKLAAEYRIPEAQWFADLVSAEFFWREASDSGVRPGVRPEAYQELLWYDPTVEPRGLDEVPTSRYFPDLGLVAGRTSWDPDAVLVSFKAAPGGGHRAWEASHRLDAERGWTTLNTGHHHPDAGSFVLIGAGEYLAIDEGYSSHKRVEHHNGILVDGAGFGREGHYDVYAGLDVDRTARMLHVTLEDGWVHAVSEIGAMFDPALGIERVRRHLVRTPDGVLVIVDELRADGPRRWTWLLQTDNPAVAVEGRPGEEPGAEPGAQGVGLTRSDWIAPAGTASLRVVAFDAQATTHSVHPTTVQANPTSSTPGLSIEHVQHTLRRTTEPRRAAHFVTVLEPLGWGADDASSVSVRLDAAPGASDLDGATIRIERDAVPEEVRIRFDGERPDVDAAGSGGWTVGAGFAGLRG